MNIEDLPLGKNPQALDFPHFPSRQQAVVWRNWGVVTPEKLASVLRTDKRSIVELAKGMGLPENPEVDPKWIERGYLSIIRNNWHLLPYKQLLELLDYTPEHLSFILKEDDFMWGKMGNHKPKCEPVVYTPLTEDEKKATEKARLAIERHFPSGKTAEKPFGFLEKYGPVEIPGGLPKSDFEFNYVHSYSAVYGDALLHPELDPFPESLLAQYSSIGVKGVWLQSILYSLYPIEGAEEYSEGWRTRLKNLKELVEKTARHGVGIYLYMNEPRFMPESFYKKFPDWTGEGASYEIGGHNCTTRTRKPVEWMKKALAHVFKEVPGLAGAFFITMSENATHCHSRSQGHTCDHCKDRPAAEIIAEILTAAEEGVHSSAPNAKVIAWNWAWRPEWQHEVVDRLPKNVHLMCVSEWGRPVEFGGAQGEVIDYSISHVGPSQKSLEMWEHAKKRGIKTIAKVQLNNSWECSAVPYIPVPFLVQEHLDNLRKLGLNGIMLGWSLGGWPGGNLELLHSRVDKLAEEKFGRDAAPSICEAWKCFSDAFRNFPFNVQTIYTSPVNYGPMNLLHENKTGYAATMIGFPYDDLKSWRSIFPEDVFEKQFEILTGGWKKGLDILRQAEKKIAAGNKAAYEELSTIATAAYCHFRSTFLQTRFVRLRDASAPAAEIVAVVDEEISLAATLAGLAEKDSRIGYEASNHYYYTPNLLKEKVMNCLRIKELYTKGGRQ